MEKFIGYKDFTHGAFTLVEVLITLGIIGVVAALTLPTLITNYKKKTYATRAHKAYSELLQAIKLSENDNGTVDTWNCETSVEGSVACVEKYIKPYYKDLKLCATGYDKKCGTDVAYHGANYITNSGVSISMVYNTAFYALIDVNAAQPPGVLGIDAFYFTTINSKNLLLPYGYRSTNYHNRNNILENYCTKDGSRYGCTMLLYLDNWEIKDDYPWQ